MVALFGIVYLWLALRPALDAAVVPVLVLGAVGKAGFFAIYVLTWWRGELPGLAVASAGGDLLLAAVFGWWVLTRQPAATAAVSTRGQAAA